MQARALPLISHINARPLIKVSFLRQLDGIRFIIAGHAEGAAASHDASRHYDARHRLMRAF